MIKFIQHIHPVVFVVFATIFEVSGDALIRKCIYDYTGLSRLIFLLLGAVLLFCYGFFLNLAPVEFGQLAGLYITILFIVWQIINYITFHKLPTLPTLIGGTLIVAGGLIITFWKPK